MKADLFSAATTLFLMVMQSPPFRRAHQKDPYFKRLCAADRKPFWNIFKSITVSQEFKDFFEGLTRKDPEERFGLKQIFSHPWLISHDRMDPLEMSQEILARYAFV
jgi:serine/threonine protein kinase